MIFEAKRLTNGARLTGMSEESNYRAFVGLGEWELRVFQDGTGRWINDRDGVHPLMSAAEVQDAIRENRLNER